MTSQTPPLLIINGMRWTISVYNPHRSDLSYRREQIIRELQRSHILGLVGTRTDASRVGQAVVQKAVAGHTWIEWGRGKGSHEQAAGVALAFRSEVFRDSNVRQVFRFGAVRLIRGDVEFCPIVVYQYPEPNPPRAERQRQRANRLWQYISGFIDKLPHRCVLVLTLDVNGHTGLMRVQGATAAIDSSAVGNSGGELVNFSGHALKALLEQQHMCAVNTFGRPGFDCGSTVYGTNQRGTRVEYICLPQSLLCDISRVRVHIDKAKKLQWHVCPGLCDHLTMSMEFKHALSYDSRAKLAFNRFDRDRLANAALTGAGRHEFLETVDAKCAQAPQQLGTSQPRPAAVWRHLQQAMHEATSQHFSASSRRDRERPADITAALQFTAHARKAVVELPAAPAPRDSLQFLSNLMQQWRRVAHFWQARRACDQLLKRDYKQLELRRVEEFNHYWSKPDTIGCHGVSRLLSRFRMGPKMRRYDRPRSVQPTCEDWQLFLEQSGPQGGCLVTPCSWDVVVRHACDPKPMQTTILAGHEEATHDLRGFRWVSKKLSLRKGCPTWSVPSEVWRQVLHPTRKIATRHFGVGFAQTQQLFISHFDWLLFRLLVSIRAYDETPVQWESSQVATLDKHNGKSLNVLEFVLLIVWTCWEKFFTAGLVVSVDTCIPDPMLLHTSKASHALTQSYNRRWLGGGLGKQVHHVLFRGTGADENMRAAYGGKLVSGKIARCFKYLGGLSQHSGRNAAEIGARLRAANSEWYCFRLF